MIRRAKRHGFVIPELGSKSRLVSGDCWPVSVFQSNERPHLRKEKRKEKTQGGWHPRNNTRYGLWPLRVPRKQRVSCANRSQDKRTTANLRG